MIFFENSKFKYFVSWPLRKHKVTSRASGQTIAANAAQLNQLREIFVAAKDMPWGSSEAANEAAQCIYIGFCMTVHGFEDVGQIFMKQDPAIAALTLGTIRG